MLIQCCSSALTSPQCLFYPKVPFQNFTFLSSCEACKMVCEVNSILNRMGQVPYKRELKQWVLAFWTMLTLWLADGPELRRWPDYFCLILIFMCISSHHFLFRFKLDWPFFFFFFSSFFFSPFLLFFFLSIYP